MDLLNQIYESVKPILPSWVAVIGVIIALFLIRYFLQRHYSKIPGLKFRSQIITLILVLLGIVIVILLLPIKDTSKGQLLSLLGILLSAIIALSSTTFIGNAMAGLMLRAIRSFRPGDFISVGDYFGRISDRGLFHTEIQTIDSDLTTLPNMYLITNPVKVVRSSGTIISADVSLGYDVSRTKIEDLLLQAAEAADLEEPFMHVVDLGDFSVTYRISGLLKDVKHLISARSRLRKMMLDVLQRNGVEIVSPTYMNTRAVPEGAKVIPEAMPADGQAVSEAMPQPEKLVFEKADEAESIEKLRETYENLGAEMEKLRESIDKAGPETDVESMKGLLERIENRRENVAAILKRKEEEKKDK
ncbi:MAG: mechanosensitive ion channel family protein [candidate division Zixibacteria bacterium]|nr:mechanosensitive ion channel family protein [candidate division Zixibacteria bacterium]NIT54180.1 mechanosensitive ion channel family protein [candidate division Zixibacteria bacterium]NIW42685.1 mechanosensitive ion channel [candidate division Zixibacteria bacterium]NIX57046.1 mechanosensitive ion channel [candidate division Zixibacteria bacterium]